MSRTSRRRDTKTKSIPGSSNGKRKKQQLVKFKYPRRSKHHRGLKPRRRLVRDAESEPQAG